MADSFLCTWSLVHPNHPPYTDSVGVGDTHFLFSMAAGRYLEGFKKENNLKKDGLHQPGMTREPKDIFVFEYGESNPGLSRPGLS